MTQPTVTVDLVKAAQAGDRESRDRLFERYYDRVRRAVGIRMGHRVRSWTESGDIMTRTFVKALEKFDTFEMRSESSLLRWMVKIAEGMIHDVADEMNAKRRDRGRESSIEFGSADSTSMQMPLPDPATSITQDLGRREDGSLVDDAIAALEPADRELLLQYYYMEMSWEEIAEQNGDCGSGDDRTTRDKAADAARKRAAVARSRLAIQLQKMRGGEAAAGDSDGG